MTTSQQIAKANYDLLNEDEKEELYQEIKKDRQNKKEPGNLTPEQIEKINDKLLSQYY